VRAEGEALILRFAQWVNEGVAPCNMINVVTGRDPGSAIDRCRLLWRQGRGGSILL